MTAKSRQWLSAITMEDPGLIGNKYAEGQLPYLKANPSDGKVQFSFRGRIARLGAKQEGGKPKSGEIPSWAQYTLVVQEHYADKDGVPLEVLETKFGLEKKE
jgi:hypothetical protein